MSAFFTYAVLTATIASAVQYATPFLLAALGETLGQRSGVLNLGVDGIMLMGAFACYYVALETGSDLLGVLVGMGVGALMGLVTAFMSVTLRAQQGISGIGVYIFGLGMSDLLFVRFVGTPLPVNSLPTMNIPLLSKIPAARPHVLSAERAHLHRLPPRPGPGVCPVPHQLRDPRTGRGREPGGGRQRRDKRRPYPLLHGGPGLHDGRAGRGRPCSSWTASSRRTSPRAPALSPSPWFISAPGGRPGVMTGSLLYGVVTAVVLQWKSLGIIPTSAADLAATAPAVITVLALVALAGRFKQPAALGKPYVRGA